MDILKGLMILHPKEMKPQEGVRMVIASEADSEVLCRIQRAAFDSESQTHQWTGQVGPDGYGNREGLKELMGRTDLFKIVQGEITVGGVAVVDSEDSCRLVRIFIDPVHQGKGIGHDVFALLLERYPDATVWKLDTPSWSLRNHRFYESLGFRKVGETDRGERGFALFLYEREE
jgi:GNAT superfamily N-acetyltransferase